MLGFWSGFGPVTLLEVSERVEGAVALHLSTELLNLRSGWEQVLGCQHSNYQLYLR